MELDDRTVAQANDRAKAMQAEYPRVIAARYDRRTNRVILQLSSRLEVAFTPQDAEGLEQGSPAELSEIEISPSGFGIHFPKLDADLYLPALLEGFLGSKKWMAARMGAAGGRARSLAKASAAKANGAKGGRPRKNQVKSGVSSQAPVRSKRKSGLAVSQP
ncbi:MAG TPA: DUF2442 domain-containing protein [Acidobacteriaceae bacterium]